MGIIGDIKSIGEIVQKADNIELYRKILDLQYEAMNVIEQLNELKEENRILKEKLKTVENLTFKGNMYFKNGVNEPFCSKCWDADSKLVRLHGDGAGWFQCPLCKTIVHNEVQIFL
ncbi:hypothetical protein [Ammoniphilus resinae]|uniref:Uncharacterized protein n=1 Tax=Ammoniphilus resinae TaxID=861532 RepID=A0ABS4GPC7_9BACL|nr:hypothetical protein [Ammoniphilus resinae]MBP1931977.1 hypothetical protein [Ammoniphilus resinae]